MLCMAGNPSSLGRKQYCQPCMDSIQIPDVLMVKIFPKITVTTRSHCKSNIAFRLSLTHMSIEGIPMPTRIPQATSPDTNGEIDTHTKRRRYGV